MGPPLASVWTLTHPPKPEFTKRDVASLRGKVYIVTGSNTSVGKELARILYSKDAKVYFAARTDEKATKAIQDIKDATPSSKGDLVSLKLDLADLSKVKDAVERFLGLEQKLNVLFKNAGVMTSSAEPWPKTEQGHELNLGVNSIGTFLFTKLLTPLLARTAQSEPANSVQE